MNISKDGKTLYFSDEEIDSETNGEKKVFVTKRINGKESHVKAEKRKNIGKHLEDNIKQQEFEIGDDEIFSFNSEMVLGVNSSDEKEEKTKERRKKSKVKKEKNKKKPKKERTKDRFAEQSEQPTKPKTSKKRKKTKKKKINKKLIGFFSIIILIAIIVVLALTAPIFNITDITVNGNNQVSTNMIINLSGLRKGENIFKFNSTVEQKIKENTYIESVNIKRKLPGTVIISVEERTVKYQINLINSYVYIDKNGYILENSSEKKDVPVIVGLSIKEDEMLNEKRLKTEDLEKLNDIIKIIDSAKTINIDNLITEINTENKENYVLYLESKGKKINLGDTSNLTNKMLYVKKILEKEEGKTGSAFVNGDLSAGFKPYFREE